MLRIVEERNIFRLRNIFVTIFKVDSEIFFFINFLELRFIGFEVREIYWFRRRRGVNFLEFLFVVMIFMWVFSCLCRINLFCFYYME